MAARTKWSDLPAPVRRAIVVGGAVDAGARIAALIDLARRPAVEVRGRKALWAAGLVLVNCAGVLPTVYFLRGRRTR